MAELPDAPEGEAKVRGYVAIAAVLSELFGDDISDDAAFRLASRRVRPLPVDGYAGRVWSCRSWLVRWVEEERQRRNRTNLTSQLGLPGFDAPGESEG